MTNGLGHLPGAADAPVDGARSPAARPVGYSVVICTRDRAATLSDVLVDLAGLHVPADVAWEVVVCDNGSSDHTPAVAAAHAARLPLRLVRTEPLGVSHARNAGVAAARGRWILFLDDDVRVPPGWLAAWDDALRAHPGVAYAGGRIDALFEGRADPVVRVGFDPLRNYWSILPIEGDEPAPGTHHFPYAANMALRRDWALRFPFDEGIGYRPGEIPSPGEENDVMLRMRGAGATGLWVPEARVQHRLGRARLNTPWLCARLRGSALESVRLGLRRGRGVVLRVPLHVWYDVARFGASAVGAALTLRPSLAVARLALTYQRAWTARFAFRGIGVAATEPRPVTAPPIGASLQTEGVPR